MELARVCTARIHPAIGIARIGDSAEYFIGPEVPAGNERPQGGYKDAQGRLKRQAARFRIFGYDEHDRFVGEITSSPGVDITWHVHVANKKAAWYDFLFPLDVFKPTSANWRTQAAPRRNPQIGGGERAGLVIDAGLQSIPATATQSVPLDAGSFFGKRVPLGEILAEKSGRLVFLAGRGNSASIYDGSTPTSFANNAGWHDDIADGPVGASVRIGERAIAVDPAWIVTAPPNYAPGIPPAQTLYDVIYDAYAGWWFDPPSQTFFGDHILPLFERLTAHQWVNKGFFERYGWQAPYDFGEDRIVSRLNVPPPNNANDPNAQARREIYYLFRTPGHPKNQEPPFLWPPVYGSASDDFSGTIGTLFTYTATNLQHLKDWKDGNFKPGHRRHADPASLEQAAPEEWPDLLDRAALHWCIGGPFHPGCELTWIVRQRMLYRAPLRIKVRHADVADPDYGPFLTPAVALADDGPLSASGPGDLTKWMAVPWQTDTASCRAGYEWEVDPYLPTFWPAHVPNDVLTSEAYDEMRTSEDPHSQIAAFHKREDFFRGFYGVSYLRQLERMIRDFGKFGVVESVQSPSALKERFPTVLFVERDYGFHGVKGYEPENRRALALRAGVDAATRFGRRGGQNQ